MGGPTWAYLPYIPLESEARLREKAKHKRDTTLCISVYVLISRFGPREAGDGEMRQGATGRRQGGDRKTTGWRQEDDRKAAGKRQENDRKRQAVDRKATGELRQEGDRRATGRRQGGDRETTGKKKFGLFHRVKSRGGSYEYNELTYFFLVACVLHNCEIQFDLQNGCKPTAERPCKCA